MDKTLAPRAPVEDQGKKLKTCEEDLRRYHQLALAGKLVGATMHEVNNRLAALANLIYLARTNADISDDSREYLEEADVQLRSLGEITNRSLGFIRADTEAKEIDLVELATSALRLHNHQILKKQINVRTRTAKVAPAFVRRGEIFQVVTNLLLNAVEALPLGGDLHLRIAMRSPNVTITVADNGPGIPKGMRETLFDSFKTNKAQGNGLGLWIAKEIVHGHGGAIRYKSSDIRGRSGTIFRVALPIRRTT